MYYVGIRWTWTSDHSSRIQAQQRNVNIIIIVINKIVSITDWSSSWSVQNVLDISLNSFTSIIPSHSLTSPLCLWPIIPRPATDLRKLISSTRIILFHPHPHPVNVWHSDPHKIICMPLLHYKGCCWLLAINVHLLLNTTAKLYQKPETENYPRLRGPDVIWHRTAGKTRGVCPVNNGTHIQH
jgi:hypothetical protein